MIMSKGAISSFALVATSTFSSLSMATSKCPGSGAPSLPGIVGCPFTGTSRRLEHGQKQNDWKVPLFRFQKPPQTRHRHLQGDPDLAFSNKRIGDGGCIPEGGYDSVRDEIKHVLTTSKDFWPGDNFGDTPDPNYAGLFIRLAWHCNGSYRLSDGRGGCDGGNIRHEPEAKWPDNASLDQALKLLSPIKEKFGSCLSWGDLIVLAGDTAIESGGGPVIGFCGGRIDSADGTESIPLGPSDIQQQLEPCGIEKDGQDMICPAGQLCFGCQNPLGAAVMGLIYVDPEGAFGAHGEFEPSAKSIRDVFGRMGFDDRNTVSVIGGGHAFGKCHGACAKDEASSEGFCNGNTDWENKFTSGLELKWTITPTTWTNMYFQNMFNFNWTNVTSPAGAIQFAPAGENVPDIGMLTTDLALGFGDAEYAKLSREYADDLDALTTDFGKSWYQLMTRDMGPRSRCLGDELPELQAWESKLPNPRTSELPNYIPVRSSIQDAIDSDPTNVAAFASLAFACSRTFRQTDYRGGCNGARIRFPPESEWSDNLRVDTNGALDALDPIKQAHPEVSYADLIVLAGHTAIEHASGLKMNFCGGRVDDDSGDASIGLEPMKYNTTGYGNVLYTFQNQGLSMEEGVALFATPCNGENTKISNQYYVDLLSGNKESKLLGCFEHESALLEDDLKPIVENFAENNENFLASFAEAWNYIVTSDLFDGPQNNACEGVSDPTLEGEKASEATASGSATMWSTSFTIVGMVSIVAAIAV